MPHRRLAFLLGFVACAAGVMLVLSNGAGAMMNGRDPSSWLAPLEATPGGTRFKLVRPSGSPRHYASSAPKVGAAVCVRLCDGFFFPSNASSGGDAACASECPDAPTAAYREPFGSDRIDDATSAAGAPYSALPVAGRYRSTWDAECVCHRGPVDHIAMLMRDVTLRKGDAVMTASGIRVFEGANIATIRDGDFVALAKARSLSSERRISLSTLRSVTATDTPSGRPAHDRGIWVESP